MRGNLIRLLYGLAKYEFLPPAQVVKTTFVCLSHPLQRKIQAHMQLVRPNRLIRCTMVKGKLAPSFIMKSLLKKFTQGADILMQSTLELASSQA
jgi:hypothetical protein